MKLSPISLATAVLFSSAAWALPPQMMARRSARRMNPLYPASVSKSDAVEATNATIQYSSNWSGAVLTKPPAGSTFTTASGTFTVPTAITANGNGAAAAWVGIDGDTFATAILQAGVYFSVTSNNVVEYGAFYEWWPNFATDIPLEVFPISGGDVITVDIVATSLSAGTVTLINQTKKTQFSIPQSAPTKLSFLGGQNAEWIVEDYTQNGGIVPLANWGTVNFVNASASTSTRTAVDLTGATIFDIEQFNVIYTNVDIGSSNSVSIAYA